jgi:hypothetical protein
VPAPPVPPADDFSGEYRTKLGSFSLLEGDDGAVVVSYQATFEGGGNDPHVCGCDGAGRRIGPTRIVVGDPKNPTATLDLKGKAIEISGGKEMWSGCCGEGWPGDSMKRASAKKPKSCKVTAKVAKLVPPDDLDAPIGSAPPVLATAAAGDKAEAVRRASELGDPGAGWIVRVGPPGKRVVGWMKRSALKCGK